MGKNDLCLFRQLWIIEGGYWLFWILYHSFPLPFLTDLQNLEAYYTAGSSNGELISNFSARLQF